MALSQGSAGGLPGLQLKAWALFTGAGVLVSGFNITSVAKGGTGTYSVTFTTAVAAAANQAVADVRANMGYSLNQAAMPACCAVGTNSMSIVTAITSGNAVTIADAAEVYVAVYG